MLSAGVWSVPSPARKLESKSVSLFGVGSGMVRQKVRTTRQSLANLRCGRFLLKIQITKVYYTEKLDQNQLAEGIIKKAPNRPT